MELTRYEQLSGAAVQRGEEKVCVKRQLMMRTHGDRQEEERRQEILSAVLDPSAKERRLREGHREALTSSEQHCVGEAREGEAG